MFDWLLQNRNILIGLLITGVIFAIIAIALGSTMKGFSWTISAFCLCFISVVFIGAGGYYLLKHQGSKSPLSSTPPSTEHLNGGYFYYGD